MNKRAILLFSIGFIFSTLSGFAQPNQDKIGGWYMYFYNTTFNNGPFGFQGDIQHRNWNALGDLEQLLIRSGFTYKPQNANIKFTLGYGNVTTGAYGESNTTNGESRIYQEALFPVKFGERFYSNHRFRYEQRFVEGQDFRTRYRYNFFLNIALNKKSMEKGTLYLALYDELFINGKRHIGNDNHVEIFDRNRFYSALGYVLGKGKKIQAGMMNQTTDTWRKSQFQLSFHHSF